MKTLTNILVMLWLRGLAKAISAPIGIRIRRRPRSLLRRRRMTSAWNPV